MAASWTSPMVGLLVFLAPLTPPAFAAPPDPAQAAAASMDAATTALVERIQKTYAPVDTLSAAFVQITESGLYGRDEQLGNLVMERPNRMRWTFTGSGQEYVLDGSTLWIYQPAAKQVLRFASVKEQSMIANNLLMSLHKMSEDFDASAMPSDQGHKLQLVPKNPGLRSQVKQIVLSLDDKLALAGLKLVDPHDNITDLTFSKTRLGPAVPEGTFTFEVPEGVEIIDAG